MQAVAVAQSPATPVTTRRPLTHFSSAPPDCPTAEALPAAAVSPPHSRSPPHSARARTIAAHTTTSTPVCPTPQQQPPAQPQSSASSPESPFKTVSSPEPEAQPVLSCTGKHSGSHVPSCIEKHSGSSHVGAGETGSHGKHSGSHVPSCIERHSGSSHVGAGETGSHGKHSGSHVPSCIGKHSGSSHVGGGESDRPKAPCGCGMLRWGITAAAALSLLLLVLSLARTPIFAKAGRRATIAAHGAGAAFSKPANSGNTQINSNPAAPPPWRAKPVQLTHSHHHTEHQHQVQPVPGEVLGEAELLRAHAQVILHEFELVSQGLSAVRHELGAVAGQMTAEGAAAAAAAAGCGGAGGAGAHGPGSEPQACKERAAGGNR